MSRTDLTVKAFANFSPGLGFGNPGKEAPHFQRMQTLKRLRRGDSKPVATPSELRQDQGASYPQGFKANPGLELANTFGVSQCLRR
jgi:hypothetical protein